MNLAIRITAVSLLLQACMAYDSKVGSWDIGPTENDTSLYGDSTGGDDNYYPQHVGDESASIGPALLNPEGTPCAAETAAQYALSPEGNGMAGPVLVRESIEGGTLPLGPIREYEFLNYYNFGYPVNETVVPLISVMTYTEEASDGEEMRVQLRLAVVGPESTTEEPLPLNLTVAVDTSASMEGNGIARAKAACRAVVDGLNPGDIVSLITWNSDSEILMDATLFDNSAEAQMDTVCSHLAAIVDSGTDLHNGLTAAYESALLNAGPDRMNHILFITDGGATAGVTDRALIETYADRDDAANIYLSTFGSAASPAQYNENLMKMFADAGKGEHLYADSDAEATRLIRDRYFPSLETVATDVSPLLTLPIGFQLPEGASTSAEIDLEAPGFNLSAGKTLLFHESLTFCDEPPQDFQNKITFSLNYTPENGLDSNTLSVSNPVSPVTAEALPDAFQMKTDAILSYTAALRAILTVDTESAKAQIETAFSTISDAAGAIGPDPDLDEMLNLLSKSNKLLK